MRTGAAAGHRGFFHETACYGSDEQFLAIVVPFLQGALDAGEPAVVALGRVNQQLVRAAVPDAPDLWFTDGGVRYARPASAISAYRALLAEHVARGAQQIRIVGDVPHPGVGMPWEWWARYEAAVNHLYDEFPLWGLCPYDTRITPAEVLADVARTHPYLVTAEGRHLANARFEDPAEFLIRRPAAVGDPLETAPPVVELLNPTPVAARRAVLDVAGTTELDRNEVQDLILVVSEAVTNGICHGRAPIRLRLWTGIDRIVATVTDQGPGPTSPFVGLLPTTDTSSAGMGLWLAHQLCSHLTLGRTDEGFTVRLVVGVPSVAM